jgi:hypothetical protein
MPTFPPFLKRDWRRLPLEEQLMVLQLGRLKVHHLVQELLLYVGVESELDYLGEDLDVG